MSTWSKRTPVIAFAMLVFLTSAVSADNIVQKKWSCLDQTIVHGNCMAYDPASHKLLIPQVNEDGPIYVFNADDGSLETMTLNKGSEVFGDLGCFAIGAAPDGRIFGHVHDPNRRFVVWDTINDDHPSTYPLPDSRLTRNMEIYTSASATTVYLSGEVDSGPIEVFCSNSAGDFELEELIGGVGADPPGPGGKSGVAADSAYPASIIFGSEVFSTIGIHRWERQNGVMHYIEDVPMPADVGSVPVADVAYDPASDGLIFALVCQTSRTSTPCRILAINAKTYDEEGRYELPRADAAYQRGSLVVDRENRRLYWYGRPEASSKDNPLGHWGCLEYEIPEPATVCVLGMGSLMLFRRTRLRLNIA